MAEIINTCSEAISLARNLEKAGGCHPGWSPGISFHEFEAAGVAA